MISIADFQPLSIAKINIFQQQPRFYSQICIVSKSMLVNRSRFVDTLRDAASFCSLSSFIAYVNYVHYFETLLGVNSDKRPGLETATWELWIVDERQTTPAK